MSDITTTTDPQALTIVEAQSRAEIDMQIATAKRYPRVLSSFKKQAFEMATIDQATAESCFYALKRDGRDIQGPSARLAEIVFSCWGNIRAGARIIDNDGLTITAEGVCHDLEKNVCVSVQVKRRITDRNGRTYSQDMQVVTGNAAQAIALRNAIFKVVPFALCKDIYDAAKRTAIGDSKTMSMRRDELLDFFKKLGVTDAQIFALLTSADKPIKAKDDIGVDELAALIGYRTALRENETTVDELFGQKTGAAKPTDSTPLTLVSKIKDPALQKVAANLGGPKLQELWERADSLPDVFEDLVRQEVSNV